MTIAHTWADSNKRLVPLKLGNCIDGQVKNGIAAFVWLRHVNFTKLNEHVKIIQVSFNTNDASGIDSHYYPFNGMLTNIMADLKRNGWHHYQINIIIGIGTTWSACVLHLWTMIGILRTRFLCILEMNFCLDFCSFKINI